MKRNSICTGALLLTGACMLMAPMAYAGKHSNRVKADKLFSGETKRAVQAIAEVEIDREIDTLPDDIEHPSDPDVADTALVFTNLGRHRAAVKCVGFDKNGTPIGRTTTRIPAMGVRYVLASDISNGVDFIGQVQCARHGRVIGSVIFIGPGITDLPVLNRLNRGNQHSSRNRIQFPLVAHY
jgi:hypothetical protein